MEYVNLETYASRMIELSGDQHGLKPLRLEAERSRLAAEMHRILKPSVRRLAARKNMTRDQQDDIDQHTLIAICRALQDWDPSIATFSTHVHWRIRAELQTLQHFEFPDRRKLAVPHKINFLELDRPYTIESGDTCTMADFLVSEGAQDLVQEGARQHIALHTFERVFSHSIARQMQVYCVNNPDEGKIATKRHSLMRNRWIYVRRTLFTETYEQIAQEYNMTRERARQIISKIDEELKGQLPRFCKKTNEVIHSSKEPPRDIHASWDYLLIDFYMATGEDTRLFGRGTPMPTRPGDYDFRPAVRMEIVEQDASAEAVEEEPVSNVVPMGIARTARNVAAAAAIAGAMLTSAVAANAQSRAIPPQEAIAPQAQEAPDATEASARPARPSAPRVAPTRDAPMVAIDRIATTREAWGVRVVDYASERDARAKWAGERRSWSWLRGLRAAYIAPGATPSHGVAFGPLSEAQAQGMCHEARRVSRQCVVVRFGAVRQASSARKDRKA